MTLSEAGKHNSPVIKLHQPDDSFKIKPVPEPTGLYPFHLALNTIIPDSGHRLTFFMVGDTGSVRNTSFQHQLSAKMIALDASMEKEADKSRFLYHLGDVVYNFGEADLYYEQFFSAYEKYQKPVFAIAGNHDSDVNPEAVNPYKSLEPFCTVFCSPERTLVPFPGNDKWMSTTQPNVYWTMETDLATIIGLHSNVPKYGYISNEQKAWFKDELLASQGQGSRKALIVCIHHAPYSADINHGSSLPMIEFLEACIEETSIIPDIVFSGHVHNYQRLHKTYPGGKTVPYIVAGAGGYDVLHAIADRSDKLYSAAHPLLKEVKLEQYCDDKHGFLRISLERIAGSVRLTGEYYTLENESPDKLPKIRDLFSLVLE